MAFGATAMDRAAHDRRVIEDAMEQLRELCLLVDVRTPREFRAEHIEGSLHVPLGELGSRADEIVRAADGRQVALVCRSGLRAERARRLLAARTDLDLQVLAGGVLAWGRAGHPLVRPPRPAPLSLQRQVHIVSGGLLLLGSALACLVHPAFVALVAFVGLGLVHAGVTDTCALGAVLERMPWNREAAACTPR